MKYILNLNFKDIPECINCMLCRNKGLDLNGETVKGCSAIGIMPKCPEEGCLKTCPLVLES